MKPPINTKLLRHQAVHKCNLNMDRQVCVMKTVAERLETDRKVKTESPEILLNDIFYFKTVSIGGLIYLTTIKQIRNRSTGNP